MAGLQVSGPTPWWQLPQNAGAYSPSGAAGGGPTGNLVSSAPPGYEYNPISMGYERQPASAGSRVNQFTTAALGGNVLGGLQAAANGGISGVGGGTTGVGGAGGGGGVLGGGAGISGGGNVGNIAPIDMTASNAATFANAKDQAGQEARASLSSLQGILGETGQMGGGASTQAARDVTENALGQLGAVTRQNAVTNAGQNLDVAKTNQATQLAERGQNIAAQEAQARLAQQQVALQFQEQMARSQQSLELLRLALGTATNAMGQGAAAGFAY